MTINITSYDLFALDDWRRPRERFSARGERESYRSKGLVALRAYQDLEAFANIECLGSAEYAIDPAARDLMLRSVTIAGPVGLMADKFVYQECFNRFLGQRFAKLPATIAAAALPSIAAAFDAACLDSAN